MYNIEIQEFPKKGETIAVVRTEEPRTVIGLAIMEDDRGFARICIDCGKWLEGGNDDEGYLFVDGELELNGELGWRHTSEEEFDELFVEWLKNREDLEDGSKWTIDFAKHIIINQ